jgi:hypothetical protein
MTRDAKIVAAAEAFVRAHCELEDLAACVGVALACESMLNERVIDLHLKLEEAVLGDEHVPGRQIR